MQGCRHHGSGVVVGGRLEMLSHLVPLLIASCLQCSGEEDCCGQVRRSGRALRDVHACGDVAGWQATDVAGGGDERERADRGGAEHAGRHPSVSGGRDTERVASRAVFDPCGGDRGGGSGGEPRAEGRSTGRVVASGGYSDGADPYAGVQGSEVARGIAERGECAAPRDAGRGSSEEPPEGGAAFTRHRDGQEPLRSGEPEQVAGAASVRVSATREWLGRELDQLVPLRDEAEEWLLEESKSHPIIRKLSTAPGMGPIRTAQLVAIVGTPDRFRTRRQFWSYCGLAIVLRSSSDWVRNARGEWVRSEVRKARGLTRKRQPVLKSIFKGAATTVIAQLPDDPLHEHYQRMLESGIKPNLAKLTLARRIAAIVLSMWRNKEVYDPKRHLVVTDKA